MISLNLRNIRYAMLMGLITREEYKIVLKFYWKQLDRILEESISIGRELANE